VRIFDVSCAEPSKPSLKFGRDLNQIVTVGIQPASAVSKSPALSRIAGTGYAWWRVKAFILATEEVVFSGPLSGFEDRVGDL
jgi:hypothetical protein